MNTIFSNPQKRDNFGDLGAEGRIILKWISREICDDVDWINLAEDTEMWRVLVNMVMNIWLPYDAGKFLVS
jgi:hypothetical protein